MAEIIIALTIIGALVAVMVPVITDRIRKTQIEALASTLDYLRDGIQKFRRDVSKYPRFVYNLQFKPVGGLDACGSGISSINSNNWEGPYIAVNAVYQSVTPGAAIPNLDGLGIAAAEWQINDRMVRTPATAASSGERGRLEMQVDNFRIEDAQDLNNLVDGTTIPAQPIVGGVAQDTAGIVRWGGLTNGSTTVSYGLMIAGC